jgi:hypothetical protein
MNEKRKPAGISGGVKHKGRPDTDLPLNSTTDPFAVQHAAARAVKVPYGTLNQLLDITLSLYELSEALLRSVQELVLQDDIHAADRPGT